MRVRKITAVSLLIVLLPLSALTLYLRLTDLSELRPHVARFVSHLIGRTLTIDGAFSATIGRTIEVEAEQVRLANPSWSAAPSMAEADSVSIGIDVFSLFVPPVRFVTSSVRGSRLNLEKNSEGGANWQFGKGTKPAGHPKTSSPLLIEHLRIDGLRISYADRSSDAPAVLVDLSEMETTRLEGGSHEIRTLRATWGSNTFALSGRVGKLPSLIGTDLTVDGTGPDISPLATLARIRLAGAYSLSGRVERTEDGFRFHRLSFESMGHRLFLEGSLGNFPRFDGTDLTVEAAGPDLSPLAPLVKIEAPPRPYSLQGRVEWTPAGLLFRRLSFRSGDYRLRAQGRLGPPPRFEGTDLALEAAGPDIPPLFRLPWLPADSFDISASLKGNPAQFQSNRFRIRLGRSDVGGSFRLDLAKNPPDLTLDLQSGRFDVAQFLSPSASPLSQPPTKKRKKLLLPDEPLDFDFLRKIDGRLKWKADSVLWNHFQTRDLSLDLTLAGGVLRVNRAEGARGSEERVHLAFLLEPSDGGYHIAAKIDADRLRPKNLAGIAETSPLVDLRFEFDGTGRSVRELARNGTGTALLNASAGVLKSKIADLFRGDLLKAIANSLNPFGKEQTETKLECGVAVAHLEQGEAKLDALAVKTDTTTVAGDGRLRIEDERLAFEWAAKPRQGIGLSATSLSEPYVKLGGTLSEPGLEVKLVSAGVSTGVAIATMGLSVLAKGVWNRVSSGSDVCGAVRKRFGIKSSGEDRLP